MRLLSQEPFMPAHRTAAARFHTLHEDFLILPNAWDGVTAKLIEQAGAKAIAASSAAVAWAHGDADGHAVPISRPVRTIEDIARVGEPVNYNALIKG